MRYGGKRETFGHCVSESCFCFSHKSKAEKVLLLFMLSSPVRNQVKVNTHVSSVGGERKERYLQSF